MSELAFSAFAGFTVYAVPQVIAATSPMGATAVQMGTLVKLVRVLILGPVCPILSFMAPRLAPDEAHDGAFKARMPAAKQIDLAHLVPWFIVGFLALLACRSADLVPTKAIAPIGRVTAVAVLSLLGLGGPSLALLNLLHMP